MQGDHEAERRGQPKPGRLEGCCTHPAELKDRNRGGAGKAGPEARPPSRAASQEPVWGWGGWFGWKCQEGGVVSGAPCLGVGWGLGR